MKIRTDMLKMYKEIHGWVGILSGLALFVAFYAGAITMFEEPVQRWASPQSTLAPPVPIERAPELIAAVTAMHPEAAKRYDIHVETGPEAPARMSWTVGNARDEHGPPPVVHYASLAPDGSVQVEQRGPSPVAQFVDVLHQHVGLPFEPAISRAIMGAICLLYALAIVSGVIVLLPSLVSDLFAMRVGKNVKRMWLDLHNVLGIFSLPFHLIMALTGVVFAFHDQFYDLQDATFAGAAERPAIVAAAPELPEAGARLAPAELIRRVNQQAPEFEVLRVNYELEEDGHSHISIQGRDPRYGHRGPTFGMAEVDAYTGALTEIDYLPGKQGNWGATISSFFALHFGNFGGTGVRWAYFLLGLAGAFLFYTGNLLWIESRRKRERKAGAVKQTKATRVLGALTVGVPLGCIAGIAVTLAASRPLGIGASMELHSAIYFSVFVAFTVWALLRGAPRSSGELLLATAGAFALMPLSSLAYVRVFPHGGSLVDVLAVAGAALALFARRQSIRRGRATPRDSVWALDQGVASGP